ncbi:MAG: signal peptide peptidase SppA [Xanthomonadales bacterium]|nr:signal peptide peptidase SppA [Xanthomonadales bacterium]
MNQPSRGAFVNFVIFFWDALNFSRRLLLNGLLLLVLGFLLYAVLKGGPTLEERNAFVLAPKGRIVEQFTADAASRALGELTGDSVAEVQLRDLLRAIDSAATDKRIERMVIRTDQMAGAGFAALREVGAALKRFKESGKQIVAYADNMDQAGYYLAAHADEVYLHPSGAVLLEGIGRYRAYYREALQDKLGVKVHLFRVGEFKSFAEPYIRDNASPEANEADLYWMTDIWQRYLSEVAELRELKPETLQAQIDGLDVEVAAVQGDLAQLALRMGLVDELKTADEFRALMIERGEKDEENHTFRQVNLEAYLGFLDREKLPIDSRPKVAVVVAQGGIADGELPQGQVGGVSTSSLIRRAREDEDVKALVLRVDSPGGGVFPSEQIRREVELTRAAGKPVVVSMANVAASGGYWISMNAQEIYADPSTITGSIGIFGLFFTAEDTLARVGVRSDGVGTTRIAGAFDPTRPLDPMVGTILQTVIEDGYRDFINRVAEARGKSYEDADKVGRGRVWSGAQALELGLVDKLGGLRDAIDAAAGFAELAKDSFQVSYVEKEPSPFEKFLADLGKNATARAVAGSLGLPPGLAEQPLVRQLREELELMAPPVRGLPARVLAHCLCSAE